MPSAFATQLVNNFGGPKEYRFSEAIQLKTATSLKSSEIAIVSKYEPWNNKGAKELLNHHPVAIWSNLSVRLAPRAGIYGRMCTFYGGWAAAGMTAPKTIQDMVSLHGAIDVTYGGTGDPGTVMAEIPCQFDDTMQDLLKVPYGEAGRPVFYYFFTEQDVVTGENKNVADRFMLTFRGGYELHGRY